MWEHWLKLRYGVVPQQQQQHILYRIAHSLRWHGVGFTMRYVESKWNPVDLVSRFNMYWLGCQMVLGKRLSRLLL